MKYEITVEVGSSDKRHLGHEIAKMNKQTTYKKWVEQSVLGPDFSNMQKNTCASNIY